MVERSAVYEDLGYGYQPPKATAPRSSATLEEDSEPTPDQIYLADALSKVAPKGRISDVMLVRLNRRYGVQTVTDSLRMARGFAGDIHSAFGYVEKLCKEAAK